MLFAEVAEKRIAGKLCVSDLKKIQLHLFHEISDDEVSIKSKNEFVLVLPDTVVCLGNDLLLVHWLVYLQVIVHE